MSTPKPCSTAHAIGYALRLAGHEPFTPQLGGGSSPANIGGRATAPNMVTATTHHSRYLRGRGRWFRPRDFRGIGERFCVASPPTLPLTWTFLVVGTGVDPVTFRFSGGRSAD